MKPQTYPPGNNLRLLIVCLFLIPFFIHPGSIYARWRYISDFLEDLSLARLIFHPHQEGVFYFTLSDDTEAIYRAEHYGETITRLPHFVENAELLPRSLLIDPSSENRLISVMGTGSSSGYMIFSSDNGGRNWAQHSALPYAYYEAENISITPGDAVLFITQRVYARHNYVTRMWRTPDLGMTYQELHMHRLRFDPQEPHRMYAWGDTWLYESGDYGENWTEMIVPEGIGIRGFAVDALNSNTLYLSGNRELTREMWLWRSLDRGLTWHHYGQNLWDYMGSAAPGSVMTSWAGDGILYLLRSTAESPVPILRSLDGGSSWHPFVHGLPGSAWLILDPFHPMSPWAINGGRLYRWIEENQRPFVTLAGYEFPQIDISRGGQVILRARVLDPNGPDDIERVELMFQGMPTGIELRDDGNHNDYQAGDGIYGFEFWWPADSGQSGEFILEIIATDRAGEQSNPWPYLTVLSAGGGENLPTYFDTWTAPESGLALLAPKSGTESAFTDGPGTGSPPKIPWGGWTFTDVRTDTGGLIELAAIVVDPDGSDNLNAVEIYAQGAPTGLLLDTEHNLYAPYGWMPDIYTFVTPAGDGIPPGNYIIEISARDLDGNRSSLWPYLTVK